MDNQFPPALCREKRWVTWRLEERDGEQAKVPYAVQAVGALPRRASSTDPDTWSSHDDALAYLQRSEMTGLGFVLGDGWCGIDLDHHVIEGVPSDVAARICQHFNSYAELSPSRTGIHIIARAIKPGSRCKKYQETNPDGSEQAIEIYDKGRYFTMTGDIIQPYREINDDATPALTDIYNELFPPEAERNNGSPTPTTVSLDDQEIVDRAKASKNGAKFAALWDGDCSGYESHSEADLALANLLMFWCGRDQRRVDALFRQSGLMRPKWDRKLGETTYGAKTLSTAFAGVTEVYTPSKRDSSGNGSKSRDSEPSDADLPPEPPSPTTDGSSASSDPFDEIKYTDGWRARQLVRLHGQDMLWSAERDQWYVWDEARFQPDNTNQTRTFTRDVTRLLTEAQRAAIEVGDEKAAAYYAKQASKADTQAKYNAMLTLAQSEPGISVALDWLDADPMLFNVLNGTVDLRTGELLPHKRSDKITKLAPVVYDRAARCPDWDEFLDRIMAANKRLIAFLQRAVGYSMTGVIRETILLILHGTGANGKTVCIETLTRLLGDYARHSTDNLLVKQFGEKHPAGIASLMGARFVLSTELDKDDKLDEGLVKRITGGDTLNARFMGQNPFDFQPSHKIWVTANELPEISGTDKGIWRRIRKIPFSVEIPDDEQKPLDKMLAIFERERSGILNWAIEGCLAWQKDGISEPPEVTDATSEYQAESDVVARFLEDRTTDEPLGEVKASQLFGAFRAWCDLNGESQDMTQQHFGRRMTTKGYERVRKEAGQFYQGIMFRDTRSSL
jgi:putative DNA primase/helicase